MKKTRDTKSILLRVLLYLFVILVVLVTLYPYFVMFTTAAKSRAEIYSTDGTLLPIHWLWQNFKDIWTLAPLSRYFINSLIVAGGSTLIAIVCGIPAAYALARMKFKGKKIFLGIVIISQMFAPVVLLVGIYKIMSTFGMTDSLVGLVFINAAFNQAFAIWLLRGTFISISPEMEQAATVDGCGKVSALIRILLPVSSTWYRYCPDFRIHQRLERIYRCSDIDFYRCPETSDSRYYNLQWLQYGGMAVSVCILSVCNSASYYSFCRNRETPLSAVLLPVVSKADMHTKKASELFTKFRSFFI